MSNDTPPAARWPKPFFAALAETFGSKPRFDEPLSGRTTSRLGGPAEVWLPVTTLTELVEAVKLARQFQVPCFILGGGANLLIGDGGLRGLVIGNRAGQVYFLQKDTPAVVTVESGVVLPNLARRCARRGLSGLEWAVGVPGTIGGAITNNAGAYGSDMAAILIRAELLSPDGERVWQPVTWFEYAYRTSVVKKSPRREWVVLQAELQLTAAPADEVQARMTAFNERRKGSQPPGATMGSMFKNPPGDYAGRLIEAAGLKGHQIGQARISPAHANFFQNLGGATAFEMIELINLARSTVEARFGIKLELEIEVIGEFES